MTSLFAHASTQEGVDFEAAGTVSGTTYTLTGNCDQYCDGNISVRVVKRYEKNFDPEYFFGHLTPDGSIVGNMGFDENGSQHANRFIWKRTQDEIMCYRPSPIEFQKNKARALWKFAYDAVCGQVRREKHWWAHVAARRDPSINEPTCAYSVRP